MLAAAGRWPPVPLLVEIFRWHDVKVATGACCLSAPVLNARNVFATRAQPTSGRLAGQFTAPTLRPAHDRMSDAAEEPRNAAPKAPKASKLAGNSKTALGLAAAAAAIADLVR